MSATSVTGNNTSSEIGHLCQKNLDTTEARLDLADAVVAAKKGRNQPKCFVSYSRSDAIQF